MNGTVLWTACGQALKVCSCNRVVIFAVSGSDAMVSTNVTHTVYRHFEAYDHHSLHFLSSCTARLPNIPHNPCVRQRNPGPRPGFPGSFISGEPASVVFLPWYIPPYPFEASDTVLTKKLSECITLSAEAHFVRDHGIGSLQRVCRTGAATWPHSRAQILLQ